MKTIFYIESEKDMQALAYFHNQDTISSYYYPSIAWWNGSYLSVVSVAPNKGDVRYLDKIKASIPFNITTHPEAFV